MPTIEIIAIGTELLLGEIQDTNTRYLARAVRDAGIDLYRATIIGDNPERIAESIQEALKRSDIVITTGGLGPTVDDPTRLAVALAADTELEFRPELWEQITARFQRYGRTATENNRRQAYVPVGATGVENPVGTAPAFYMEFGDKIVISLPGVPREMEHLFENRVMPLLREKFDLKHTIVATVLHASGVGESQVDEWIGDLEILTNPTVGLLAHPGQVDIRITAKASSTELARAMIEPVVRDIQKRLGENIFGMDADTLESVISHRLNTTSTKLTICLCGMDETLPNCLKTNKVELQQVIIHDHPFEMEKLETHARQLSAIHPQNTVLACSYLPGRDQQKLLIGCLKNGIWVTDLRSYGGSPLLGNLWSVNTILDFLRRNI